MNYKRVLINSFNIFMLLLILLMCIIIYILYIEITQEYNGYEIKTLYANN
jgi:hypothetical protein